MLGITINNENKMENCRNIPKKIQDLPFPEEDAKYDDSLRKTLAPFGDMLSGKLGFIKVFIHRFELTPDSPLIRLVPYWAGHKVRELE